MQNKLFHILKERLENRLEWKEYYGYIIIQKELAKKAKKEFYKDKPLKNFALKFYFLPLNLFGYLSYLKTWHYFEMACREIEMLKKEMCDEANK